MDLATYRSGARENRAVPQDRHVAKLPLLPNDHADKQTEFAIFLLTPIETIQYSPFPTAREAMIVDLGEQEVGDETGIIHRAATLLLPLA